MPHTPVSMLERLRQPGQPAVWARFVELYTPLLLHWARRLGLRPHDAADLVQEVFVTLVQKLPAFSYGRALRPLPPVVTPCPGCQHRLGAGPDPGLPGTRLTSPRR